jgi:hypothetical protein
MGWLPKHQDSNPDNNGDHDILHFVQSDTGATIAVYAIMFHREMRLTKDKLPLLQSSVTGTTHSHGQDSWNTHTRTYSEGFIGNISRWWEWIQWMQNRPGDMYAGLVWAVPVLWLHLLTDEVFFMQLKVSSLHLIYLSTQYTYLALTLVCS